MSLPVHYSKLDDITLDDLKFQNLVDEGRKRIRQYCPEWTEYNLSDPGVTLIELFAWMSELIVYRLNQVPQKNYVKFLEMLGYGLLPATAATTELTFRLAAPFPIDPAVLGHDPVTKVEQGLEVSTGGGSGEPIVFTVDRDLVIRTPRIKELCRPADFQNNYAQATPGKLRQEFTVFSEGIPQNGDAFYIGFDEPAPQPDENGTNGSHPLTLSRLAGHILRLTIHCKQEPISNLATVQATNTQTKQTAGHRFEQPPLIWECCVQDTSTSQTDSSAWKELMIGRSGDDKDTTGGLYYPTGSLTLFLPLEIQPRRLNNGTPMVWVRCRYKAGWLTSDNVYSQSPVIESIQAQTVGATTTASNAAIVGKKAKRTNSQQNEDAVTVEELAEELGVSNGEPGQSFKLKHFPILEPNNDEKIFVEKKTPHRNEYEQWDYIETFAESDKHSRHVLLNRNTGELHFGPNIRQPDGKLQPYGRVPPIGCRIFIQRYRHHAGANGNVPAGYLRVMHQSVPYVDSVTNNQAVEDGRDAESVEEAIMRAQRLMRAQERAVSASDFETITRKKFTDAKDNLIARIKCLTPDDFAATTPGNAARVAAGTVDLLLVPTIKQPNQIKNWLDLELSSALCEAVRAHLQPYCLIARSVRVRKPAYQALKVTIAVRTYWTKDAVKEKQLTERIERFLNRYFSPLAYGADEEERIDDLPAIVRNENWQGWSFGEPLVEPRLRGLVQEIEGVKYVEKLEIQYASLDAIDLAKIKENFPEDEQQNEIKKQIMLQKFDFEKPPPMAPDILYCSFEHAVRVEWGP